MRYGLNDDEFLELLAVHRTIPAVAASLGGSWYDITQSRIRMLKQIQRLQKAGRVERIGSEKSGAHGTWCAVWRVIA